VLAGRRFVIDFTAGRRMVVTDDIESKLAITEVLHRCCRALDRMDPDLMDTVWHPDGTADYGPAFQGSASGLLDVMWASRAKLLGHSPRQETLSIEFRPTLKERGGRCSRSHSFGPVSRRIVRAGATSGCAGLRGSCFRSPWCSLSSR
jgi:hypothetical protein